MDIPPLAGVANSFIRGFIDSRDEGPMILTHIYLLLGCAIPVWCAATIKSNSESTPGHDRVKEPLSGSLVPFGGVVRVTARRTAGPAL